MGILDFLKPKKKETSIASILPSEIYEAGILELKDVIAPSAMKVSPRELNLGDKIARTFFVISYPRFLSAGWFSPIINLDKVFDIAIFIHPIDTATVLRQFQKKVAEVQSQINERAKKGMVRNPMLDTAYQDLEQLRDNLMQAQEKLFDVGLYITIYGDNEEELDKLESEIKSILEAKLIYLKPALFQQEQGFRSVMPLALDELMIHSKLNSSPLSSIFPFISFDLTSDKGILYGINRHNSSLILFDRFSLENYNSITFAKSGSGKSLLGHEPVLTRRAGKISLEPIGELVERTIRERGAVPIDRELEGVIDPGLEVWSFNGEMKGSWSRVTVAARKDAPQELYRFKTRSGRVIETTGDHNLLLLRQGKIVAAKSADVTVGEYLPLPRKTQNAGAPEIILNLLEIMKDGEVYVAGAADFIAENRRAIETSALDARLDRYLYKYAAGRRVPMAYFLKILTRLQISPAEAPSMSWSITSGSGTGKMPAKFLVTTELAKILGYLVAEGTISKKCAVISNIDSGVIRDARSALQKLGVQHFTTPKSIVLADMTFIKFLAAVGMKEKSATKRVPDIILAGGQKIQSEFLKAYFEGDGGVDGPTVTAISKSKMLISDLSYLFYFFGIRSRIAVRRKMIPGKEKAEYHLLTISGQSNLNRFRDAIGFVSERKNKLLAALERRENTNVDTVPDLAQLFEELDIMLGKTARRVRNWSALRRAAFNPSQKELRRVVASLRAVISEIETKKKLFDALARLPRLEDIVKTAEQSKTVNEALWQELGSSWASIRNGMAPGFINASRAFQCAGMSVPAIAEVKTMLGESFAFLGEPLKHYNLSLGTVLRTSGQNNTSYQMLAEGAAFIAARYLALAKNLPRVREIIQTLARLAEADLAWDEIVSIEPFQNKSERYVYDLTVDNEVFLAGYGGMFVHNSYMTKLEILRTLMFDTEVIVIDPEREYEYMAEATGGKYFTISLNSPHHINPFDLPVPREDESPSDVLRSNIINLVGLFRIMLGGLTPEEDAIVDRAVSETYALKDITPDSDFSKVEPPLLSDFELVLAGMEGGDSLVQRLSKYTHGTWAGFINKPSNVDIESKFIVFSLRDMEDELKPVAMYLVTHYIWNAIRKNLRKRLLVIDEAWWMMKSEDTASFLLGLAKRGRKYFLGLATITQDVDDFLKSPYGQPIITNSSIQMLLKQSPSSIDHIQKVFNLTDEEKYLLLESDVGEGIFFVGLKHVAVKVIASYTEDQIITSDPSQLLAIKEAKKELRASQ